MTDSSPEARAKLKRQKSLGPDEGYFEASTKGWLIVTRNGKPLLYDGRMPMFWNRSVARLYLKPWMRDGGCRLARAVVKVQR